MIYLRVNLLPRAWSAKSVNSLANFWHEVTKRPLFLFSRQISAKLG